MLFVNNERTFSKQHLENVFGMFLRPQITQLFFFKCHKPMPTPGKQSQDTTKHTTMTSLIHPDSQPSQG